MPVLETGVLPEWLDHNGHMNVAGYLVAFDKACCKFCTSAGIGPDRIQSTDRSIFVGQVNIVYRREVLANDTLIICARIRAMSEDRMVLYLTMYKRNADGSVTLSAACEELAVAVSMTTRRPAAFPQNVRTWFERVWGAEAQLPMPPLKIGAIDIGPRKKVSNEASR